MMMMTNNVGKYYMRFHCYDYQKLVLILYCITIMIIILMVTQLWRIFELCWFYEKTPSKWRFFCIWVRYCCGFVILLHFASRNYCDIVWSLSRNIFNYEDSLKEEVWKLNWVQGNALLSLLRSWFDICVYIGQQCGCQVGIFLGCPRNSWSGSDRSECAVRLCWWRRSSTAASRGKLSFIGIFIVVLMRLYRVWADR